MGGVPPENDLITASCLAYIRHFPLLRHPAEGRVLEFVCIFISYLSVFVYAFGQQVLHQALFYSPVFFDDDIGFFYGFVCGFKDIGYFALFMEDGRQRNTLKISQNNDLVQCASKVVPVSSFNQIFHFVV
jgi:hypothetical protein